MKFGRKKLSHVLVHCQQDFFDLLYKMSSVLKPTASSGEDIIRFNTERIQLSVIVVFVV